MSQQHILPGRDWHLPNDFTGDGVFTISDVSAFLKWFFTYPGDWVIQILIDTDIGRFFEFSALDYGGAFAWVWSIIAFVMPYLIIIDKKVVSKSFAGAFFDKTFKILLASAVFGLWMPFLVLFGADV